MSQLLNIKNQSDNLNKHQQAKELKTPWLIWWIVKNGLYFDVQIQRIVEVRNLNQLFLFNHLASNSSFNVVITLISHLFLTLCAQHVLIDLRKSFLNCNEILY